jgi:hypothetical protein
MTLIAKIISQESTLYLTSMQEMINRDMEDIFDIFTSVCGTDKMCVAGARHIDVFDTSQITWKKGQKKTGQVVYSWDISALSELESRKRQQIIMFIQKQVKSDKVQITDQIIAKQTNLRRFWISTDVQIQQEMPAKRPKRKCSS